MQTAERKTFAIFKFFNEDCVCVCVCERDVLCCGPVVNCKTLCIPRLRPIVHLQMFHLQ